VDCGRLRRSIVLALSLTVDLPIKKDTRRGEFRTAESLPEERKSKVRISVPVEREPASAPHTAL